MFARTLTFTTRAGLAMNAQPSGYDGTIVPATLVGYDAYSDIAVLQLELTDGGAVSE